MGNALTWLQLWALVLFLSALGLAWFFGMMAWMSGAPARASRRWLRWALYPGAIWIVALIARSLAG